MSPVQHVATDVIYYLNQLASLITGLQQTAVTVGLKILFLLTSTGLSSHFTAMILKDSSPLFLSFNAPPFNDFPSLHI